MTKLRRIFAVVTLIASLSLTACQKTPEVQTGNIETPAPTAELAPTPEPTAEPEPPAAELVLTSQVENDAPIDSLTEVEADTTVLQLYAYITNVTQPGSFYIELSEPDETLQSSKTTDLAVDGAISATFEAPATGWKPGTYKAAVIQKDLQAPLAEKTFTVTEVAGPVVMGIDYLPDPNLRVRGVWPAEEDPEGSWITAELTGRPFEGYIVSRCYREDPKYIADYYQDAQTIWLQYSDATDGPIEYLPLKVRPNMEWTSGNEHLVVASVDTTFTIKETTYEKCIELIDTVTEADGTTAVIHLIYAPRYGLICEWAEPNDSENATFYVKGVEPISQEKALEIFAKVPGQSIDASAVDSNASEPVEDSADE